MRSRNIIRNAGLLAIALVASALAAPIPVGLTGLGKPVTVTSRDLQVVGGGSFNARVGDPTLIPGFATTFWCIDVENYIMVDDPANRTYDANIILVSDTTAQAQFVRKGAETAWEDGQNYSTQQRYNAAAYLVEKIIAGNSGYTNQELQSAIWRMTDLATGSDTTNLLPWNNAAYADAAANGIFATTQRTWATVSGVAVNGVLSTTDRRQTFLVEVASPEVPEPGTYALMGGGLLVLGILRRRRAK